MAAEAGVLRKTVEGAIGAERSEPLFRVLTVEPELLAETGGSISRAGIAQALNMLLFEDLLKRVPAAAVYVQGCLKNGQQVLHDHGAVRTVALSGMGGLPAGEEAITRILRPLGYAQNGLYPLERLKMTGRSHAQAEYPETVAQFFISELHPERFSPEFQGAVERVTATSVDPLGPGAVELLGRLEAQKELLVEDAVRLLPLLAACFGRQHKEPAVKDYEMLLAESAEMAWISTEGNAFNHVTDRVADVDKLAEEQKALGQPMKATVETSQSGRVRQTAFHAARVMRGFRAEDGSRVEREVAGSFLEFITRLPLPDQKLDLSFDSSNAQAIFKMTDSRVAQ